MTRANDVPSQGTRNGRATPGPYRGPTREVVVVQLALDCVGLEAGEGLDAAFRVAAAHGIEWIELFHERNYTEADGAQVVAEVAERGLRVSAVDGLSQLFRESPRAERNRRVLLYQIELAAAAGAPYAITYFGHGSERDDRRAIAVYAERLAPCLERAEQLGVTILLENEFDSAALDPSGSDITRRPEVVRELIEHVGHERFRTNFDASNYYFAGVEPFPYAYEVLEDVIDHVHVKDGHRLTPLGPAHDPELWVRTRDCDREYGWCPAGEGAVNWDGLLRALARRGYSGFISLEPHCQRRHAEDAWRQSIEFVRARIGDPA
jgi:sugar phosphate isomerase/epimerase